MKTLYAASKWIIDGVALAALLLIGIIVYVPLTIYVNWIWEGE